MTSAAITVMDKDAEAVQPLLSVTVILKVTALAAVVGVPEIMPVASNESPAGNAGDEPTAQVYGDEPPDAASVVVYAVPTVAFGSDCVVMIGRAFTVTAISLEVTEEHPLLSDIVTV